LIFSNLLFLEEIHGMCKHHLVVVFHIVLRNVYSLFEQCKIFLSIFTSTHCHVTHSFVLLIFFFHFDPHVLISSNFLRGFSRVGFLGYSKGVFIISLIIYINSVSLSVTRFWGVREGRGRWSSGWFLQLVCLLRSWNLDPVCPSVKVLKPRSRLSVCRGPETQIPKCKSKITAQKRFFDSEFFSNTRNLWFFDSEF